MLFRSGTPDTLEYVNTRPNSPLYSREAASPSLTDHFLYGPPIASPGISAIDPPRDCATRASPDSDAPGLGPTGNTEDNDAVMSHPEIPPRLIDNSTDSANSSWPTHNLGHMLNLPAPVVHSPVLNSPGLRRSAVAPRHLVDASRAGAHILFQEPKDSSAAAQDNDSAR